MSAKRKGSMGRTSAIYAAGSVVARGARFLLIPIYVHQLPAAGVGVLVFLEAVSIALSRTMSFGFSQAVKRFYIEYENEEHADNFTAALWFVGFAAALACALVLIACTLLFGHLLTRQIPVDLLALAIVSGMLRSNLSMALERYIVREEPVRHGLFNICHFTTTAGLIVLFVVGFDMGVRGAIIGDVLGLSIWNVATAFIVSRARRPRFRWSEIRPAIRYSLPSVPHGLFTWALTFSDRVILERFVPLAALGVYGIGYQLASVLPVFSLAFVNAWIPRFFRSGGDSEGASQFARVFIIQLAGLAAVSLPVVAYAPEVIHLVTRPGYAGAIPVIRVVAIGLVFHGVYQALLLPLFYRSRTASVSVVTGVALMSNVGLNLLLIPRLGIMGAAYATLGAYLATTLAAALTVARYYPLPIDTARVLALTAVSTLAGFLLIQLDGSNLLVAIPAKAAVLAAFYLLVASAPGLAAPGDPPLIRRILRRNNRRAGGTQPADGAARAAAR